MNTGDTAFLLLSAALVMLMTPGLALFYGGMVRRKNSLGTIMQSMIVIALVSIEWLFVGYSLSFGPDVSGFIGDLSWFALRGVGLDPYPDYVATVPHQAFMIYQAMFAVITPALITGAFAERIKFTPFLLFIGLWSLFVYYPVAHWVWGVGGWIRNLGALDFAGGTVVHITSGASALAAVLVAGRRRGHGCTRRGEAAGPRIGKYGAAQPSDDRTGRRHSLVRMVRVQCGKCPGGGGAFHQRFRRDPHGGVIGDALLDVRRVDTPRQADRPRSRVRCSRRTGRNHTGGGVAGVLCYGAVMMKGRIGYDDSLDVVGVHGVGGTWGALATGLFASLAVNAGGANGLFFGNPKQLVVQAGAVCASAMYAFLVTWVLFKILDKTMGLRVADEDEVMGLDLTQHGEAGYNW